MRIRVAIGLCLVTIFSSAQTKLSDGVMRYDKQGNSPAFWQYIRDQWGWVVSSRPFGKSLAFLVGAGNYQNITKLKYVSSDIQEMREFLLNSAGFDTVYVASDIADVSLVEKYMFNEFPRTLSSQDRLLFYFSGHGSDLAGTGYLQFSRAVPGVYDPNQYLDVTRCEKWSRQIQAKHILFLIDACNSGLGYDAKPGDAPHVDEVLLSLFSGDGSRVVITAGTGNEKSFQVDEGNNKGYSVFTRAFLDAIRYTQSRSGFLILDEVMAGVRRNVAAFSRGQAGRQMTPRLWQLPRKTGTDKGTFVFLNPKATAPQVPSSVKQHVQVTVKDDKVRSTEAAALKRVAVAENTTVTPLISTPKVRVNPKDGLTYIWIPAGRFLMGCLSGERFCVEKGYAPREIEITKGFWIGKTEVTQEAYRTVMGKDTMGFKKGTLLPVSYLLMDDAKMYCQRIGGRLPTDAEWEYAARAGSQEDWYGDFDAIAWNEKNSGNKAHQVGQKLPNAWGLYDVLGNVSEVTSRGNSRGGGYGAGKWQSRVWDNGLGWLSTPGEARSGDEGLRCIIDN